MDNKPASNSFKSKETDQKVSAKKLEPIKTSGLVSVNKKTWLERTLGLLISIDKNDLKRYVIEDILIPGAKQGITQVVNLVLYGNAKGKSSGGLNSSKIIYGGYINGNYKDQSQQPLKKKSNNVNFDNLIFESRGDAEVVLNRLREAIATFGMVSVLELYDICDITSDNVYTTDKYGWRNLDDVSIARNHKGYYLELPPIQVL